MNMPDSEAKKAWDKANTTRYTITLNHNTDRDILDYLEKTDHPVTELKRLVREGMKKDRE